MDPKQDDLRRPSAAPRRVDCAPAFTEAGRHGMSPELEHDDIARFNFLANFNKFMATRVVGGNALAYEARARPAFEAAQGRAPANRHEIRAAMRRDPYYRLWSALRRNAMEMRQQAGRSIVLRQAARLRDRARELNAGAATLRLDPATVIPRYQAAIDNHCMPGSYYTEYLPDDVSAAANYDVGMYATTTGLFGRLLDGAGEGTAAWLRARRPAWSPQRILDIGCGLGHNTVPLARAYPRAEVIGVDIAAPMLRYGHARAADMQVPRLTFLQADAERLPFPDGHFDFIYSTMFLHETSHKALRNILREVARLLAPGGLHVHLEQPPYHGMAEFEKFLRDWDCYYNNEPFWTTLHDTRLAELLPELGFAGERIFETAIHAIVDRGSPKVASEVEDYGRGGMWYAVGSERAG